MKTLQESLLDDEEDLINSNTAFIQQWCDTHLKSANPLDKLQLEIKNGKVSISVQGNNGVIVNLPEGEIPDYIKWDNVSKHAFFFNKMNKIKSFKNFPKKAKIIYINCPECPKDFKTYGEVNCECLCISTDTQISFKDLTGYIRDFTVSCNNIKDFDCDPRLAVNRLTLVIHKATSPLKEISSLPSIKDALEFTTTRDNGNENAMRVYTDIIKPLIRSNIYLKKIFKGRISQASWKKKLFIDAHV